LALNNARKKLFKDISAAIKKRAWEIKSTRQNEETPIN
jgi:hypothetical protein